MNIIAQNKKIITLSTVLLSALLLTGCGINSSQSTNNSSTNHNHSSKVVKTHETKPNQSTTNKSDANSISSNSSANFSSPSPLASSASSQNSPKATQSVSADSSINPQSNTQTYSSALSAPQSASNSQLAPSNSETQSDYNPTTTAPTYQLTDANVINNFISDSGLIINQGDELSVSPVDVKAGVYQLELRHTDTTNPQVAHLTTLYTYNINTHTYSVTYQASNPTQTTQQLGLNDTATWSDPDGTIHHVNSDGLDTITTPTGQTTYQDWFGPLPANAQIVHN